MTNTTKLDAKQFREIARAEGQHLVSLYAPMHRKGREVRQNEIRWKNVLREAKHLLAACDVSTTDIQKLLQPATHFAMDESFWQHQLDGLVCLLSESESRVFRLPTSFEQQVIVGQNYHIRPLLPIVNRHAEFYVLAASPKRIRLLKLNENDVEVLEPKDFPKDLQSALNIDEYVSALQVHSTSRSYGVNRQQDAVHHGHGGSDPDVKKQDELLQFFHRLNRALDDFLKAERIPLIFAGVEYLFPVFRQACQYQYLVEHPIAGNPDELSPQQLKAKAQPMMDAAIERERTNWITEYQSKAYTDWASSDPVEIHSSAKLGQVETLLLSEKWNGRGRLDASGKLEIVDGGDTKRGSIDVANLIVVETVRNRGRARDVPSEQMPQDTFIAALFRSPAHRFAEVDQDFASRRS